MLRYAITSRALFPGDERQKQAALVEQAGRWASAGIDWVQLREKDLPGGALAELARSIRKRLAVATKLVINSRLDVAVAVGADGVHLLSAVGELRPEQVRLVYAAASLPAPTVSVSCHTLEEVAYARESHVDAILFAPVFGKTVAGELVRASLGLDQLRAACAAAAPVPVYALGGVTNENATACLDAGAAGVAGIRLFHG
jgi:thiamine-phosphate pyrophosphorylase